MRSSRPSTLQSRVVADAGQAIGLAAADFEGRRKAVAVDQMAAVISNYSERAGSPQMEATPRRCSGTGATIRTRSGRITAFRFWPRMTCFWPAP
jgi:hypothetical protein